MTNQSPSVPPRSRQVNPQIKERPMLFSAPMVRAILEGRKTQTRRVIKESWNGCFTGGGPHPCPNAPVVVQPGETFTEDGEEPVTFDGKVTTAWFFCSTLSSEARCPYGAPGDRLWVKETHRFWDNDFQTVDVEFASGGEKYVHFEGGNASKPKGLYTRKKDGMKPWRPSIFMPRWASRITLEIISVRVERLQEISEADAKAEGVSHSCDRMDVDAYEDLWESIHGPDSWNANPWVWVLEFKRIELANPEAKEV